MRNLFRNILRWILKILARWTIAKYQPGIIGITGSVGKTSAKEAIFTVLRQVRRVRGSGGNLNNEFGLPLSILGNWQKGGGLFFWIKALSCGVWQVLFRRSYPELLILEYGADRPNDIKYLLEVARPQISIITAIGDIPVHVEFYSGPDAVVREKSRIVEALSAQGFAILNYDDEAVFSMRDKTRAHIITYGFGEGAEVRITNFEHRVEDGKPMGIAFKLEYGGSFVPVRLEDSFGKAQAYAAAAAAAAGIAFGMNLVRISEALSFYQAPAHRGKLTAGIKETYIIDDAYNASPLSMHSALDTIKDLKAKRKVGVLGDMLEIGKYAIEAHEEIGRLAGKVLDILVTIGPRARFIGEMANKNGMPRKNIFMFDTAEEAAVKVQDIIQKRDLVLIKGSRAMELDTIIEEIRQI